MALSELQKQALPILDWLINGEPATGRSQALAIAFIRVACRHPGRTVEFWDHHGSRTADLSLGGVIGQLLAADPRLSSHVSLGRDAFKLDLPAPILDWLPADEPIEPKRVKPNKPSPSAWEVLLKKPML